MAKELTLSSLSHLWTTLVGEIDNKTATADEDIFTNMTP